MKILRVPLAAIVCSLFLSCSQQPPKESDTLIWDVPQLLKMNREEINQKIGKPAKSHTMTGWHTTIPTGPINIPSETKSDEYLSDGYLLVIYYIPEKCKKPIEIYVEKRVEVKEGDTTVLPKLKRRNNLASDSSLPALSFKTITPNSYRIVNTECQ